MQRNRLGRDHPRSRGVYGGVTSASFTDAGSSPLARGLHFHNLAFDGSFRIIPARAGFTHARNNASTKTSDHPRSRGVYADAMGTFLQQVGSSPLARGLRRDEQVQEHLGRIIPARAGFTRCTTGRRRPRSDHPRSRGVYIACRLEAAALGGSSPLARGLRAPLTFGWEGRWIIPARAGFTLADPWNPNDEPHYQTAFAFTADLVLAPQSSDSAVVSQRSTRTPSEA